MHLVSCLLFLSSSHFSLSAPVCFVSKPLTPFPCMSRCVAAGAASFFSFFLTLSKGMDSGFMGMFHLCSWEDPPPPALLCGWAKGHGVLLPILPSPPFLPVPWVCLTNNLGKWNIKIERKPGAALPLPAPPHPALVLLGCLPTFLLGELSSEAGASDQEKKKKKLRGGRDKKPPPFSTSHTACTQFLPHLGS